MNKINAKVINIESVENLNIVTFSTNTTQLKMMSLDIPKNLKLDSRVVLSFKATTVALAKGLQGELSYSNQLSSKIVSLKVGALLCSLNLEFEEFNFESIITVDSQKRMHLQREDKVIALIKSSDLSILEVL